MNHEACPHRGRFTGATHLGEMCGQRGQVVRVYPCSFVAADGTAPHPTCTVNTWTKRSAAIPAGEISCFRCPDRPGALYGHDGLLITSAPPSA